MAEDILRNLARRQSDRFIRSRVKLRPKLGNKVDIFALQEGVLAALILSPSMGPVLYESGRRIAFYIADEAESMITKLPDYRSITESKTLDEARLSTDFAILQMIFQGAGDGVLKMTEYEKDKLIVLQVHECADCFGLKNIGRTVCYFTGGNLAGAIQAAFHREVGMVETKCTAKGDLYCEFRYTLRKTMKADERRREGREPVDKRNE